VNFKVIHRDVSSRARCGELITDHGMVETPVFMPVGTQGSIKTLTPEDVERSGTTMILNNTYHLYLRPGADVIYSMGGINSFIGWNHPVVTDSGGYQVFSLADLRTVSEEGVMFQSHIDGTYHFFTPEDIIEIQRKIGADIIMPLDRPVHYPVEKIEAQSANRITIQWAKKSLDAFHSGINYHPYEQSLFGIVQGSIFQDLRKLSIEEITMLDFPGYAIGGLSVGEPKAALYDIASFTADLLPENKLRYLMGVGKPEDLVECIEFGVDMFDCVLPTRVGRNGWAYTHTGRVVVKNSVYKSDPSPIDELCDCYACRHFSRAYIRHLFNAGEMLGPRLTSLHNITFYQRLMNSAKEAIRNDAYLNWKKQFLGMYHSDIASEKEQGERL